MPDAGHHNHNHKITKTQHRKISENPFVT